MELRLDMLTHGVNIVCAHYMGRSGGLAVAWATQVARNRILICVGKQSSTRELILASGAFGLSVLTTEQIEVARRFGTQPGQGDKLQGIWYHTAKTGSPLLDDCAATFDCRVQVVYDLEVDVGQPTEKLIVGEIVAAEQIADDYEPLIYRETDY
jgi:3-hydroxy-9,10-secoandrosta-1,3,5(10)-triene-9,17-dione monooxygenase reductase component